MSRPHRDFQAFEALMHVNFSSLAGKTILGLVYDDDDEAVYIRTDDGDFVLQHHQDCCEHVYLADAIGDPESLVGGIGLAEESSPDLPSNEEYPESFTWTFYRLQTTKGDLDLRWYGSSNGYYSEVVDFERIDTDIPAKSAPWPNDENRKAPGAKWGL